MKLLNATSLIGATTTTTTTATNAGDSAQVSSRRLARLGCRASGNPAPWIEWYRNGRLLRQSGAHHRVLSAKPRWVRGQATRLSRLELELPGQQWPEASGGSQRNASRPVAVGATLIECRAMNVAAREPSIGGYSLLPWQGNRLALIALDYKGGSHAHSSASTTTTTTSTTTTTTTTRPPSLAAAPNPTASPRQAGGALRHHTNATVTAAPRAPADTPTPAQRPVAPQPTCPPEYMYNYCLHGGKCVFNAQICEYSCK